MATVNETSIKKKKEIIVLGAGVVGLTTALKILLEGTFKVTIISDILPGDPKSIKYTSGWAGAHHVYNFINDSKPWLHGQFFIVMYTIADSRCCSS